jgi:Mg-chelatase subunit ChlD
MAVDASGSMFAKRFEAQWEFEKSKGLILQMKDQ